MAVNDISSLSEGIKEALRPLTEDDAIHDCGSAPLRIIETRPDDVLSLAHEKLHTWKFSDVSECWSRLYEEASLWKSVSLLSERTALESPRGHKRKRDDPRVAVDEAQEHDGISPSTSSDDWIAKVVYILDMAVILTGAPRRRHLIIQIFESLKLFLDPPDDSLAGSFPSTSTETLPTDTFTRKERLDFLAFQKHLDMNPKPLIMSGAIHDWPAVADPKHLWSDPAYLLRSTLGGRRLVPVELGRSYTDQGWSQKIMTFGEYMHKYLLQPKQEQIGYLAQHDLFDQIPSLAADTRTPDYCYTAPPPPDPAYTSTVPVAVLDEPLRNAWLGPAGTISPLHTDPYHNILCQVVGHKYIRLYAPSETPKLYPRGIDEAGVNMENTSYVDISMARNIFPSLGPEDIHLSRSDFEAQFPLFKDAQYIEGILGPGECLYIPVGWWHYVESLSTSFSMSFWWN